MIGRGVSEAMRRLLPSWGLCRAAIGVVVLYALMLQPFLAAATPLGTADAFGVVCAPDHGQDAPAGDIAHAEHHCCIVAHVGGLLPPPERAALLAEPLRAAVAILWRPEAWIARTGPPTHATSARGPPLA
jgi:hypothetical protein